MKKSKFMTLFLSMVLFICAVGPMASAIGVEEDLIPADAGVSRRMYCPNCEIGETALVCQKDMILLSDGYHDTWSGKCHVYLYGSYSVDQCPRCGYIVERNGIHDCREYHINCWKDDYRVCICDKDKE